jgi:hypothetical protein
VSVPDKTIRYEAMIAVGAVFISAVTAAAVVYQTHVLSQQFSATVWPYLSFDVSRGDANVSVDVRNNGIGPALIRSVEITLDGKRVGSLDAIVDPIVSRVNRSRKNRTPAANALVATIQPGEVLPANRSITLVQVSGAEATRQLVVEAPRVNLAICYCSLLGRCWIAQFDDPANAPHDARTCPG